jgi:predicted restriction endonuclease
MSAQKKKIRQNFRDAVFSRDKHKCVFCNITENLDAHHITDRNEMPNGGYVKENGISLCPKHHEDAEQFHISGGIKWVDGMHPDDLYIKIKSSKQIAIKESEKLCH